MLRLKGARAQGAERTFHRWSVCVYRTRDSETPASLFVAVPVARIGAEDQTLKPVFSGFDPGFDPVTGRV